MDETGKTPADREENPKNSQAGAPGRKVLKTMIEPSVEIELGQVSDEQPGVVKTLIDASIDQQQVRDVAEPSQPPTAKESRKVAETMIEATVDSDALIAGSQPRNVSKTLIETDLDFDQTAALQPDLSAVPEQNAAGPPEKTVAKTVLERSVAENLPVKGSRSSINRLAQELETPANLEQAIPPAVDRLIRDQPTERSGPDPKPMPSKSRLPRTTSRNLIKTLHEFVFKSSEDSNLQSLAVSPDLKVAPVSKGGRRISRQYVAVARTMLDHDVLYKELNKKALKNEVKVAEERAAVLIRSAPQEQTPVVEQIKANKVVGACPSRWDGDSKDRFRQCEQCQVTLYNFADMSRAEAEALILVRENRKKFTLFQRADGKFMTADCPIVLRRKQQTRMVAAVGIFVLFAVIAAYVLMPPPPPKPVQTALPQDAPANPGKTTRLPVAARKADGSFHYQAGQTLAPTSMPPASQIKTPAKKEKVADPDENGDFWQYADPQSAEIGSELNRSR